MVWKEKRMDEEIPYKYKSIREIKVCNHGEERKKERDVTWEWLHWENKRSSLLHIRKWIKPIRRKTDKCQININKTLIIYWMN